MVAKCRCSMDRIHLPHSAQFHRLTLQHHPESDLWTPSQGLPVEMDVYGWYSRRNGEMLWQTDLVQPAGLEVELSDSMTEKEMRSLSAALVYNLQWQIQHERAKSKWRGDKRESSEIKQGDLRIRRILPDVISKGTVT